jgi:outer membrane PBP1 activator LpoA protein
LQNSERRHQQLQDLLGLELGFQARADDNIDALFLAADQRQSRLLVPQLKFVDADYLPVFVTERSYAADRDSTDDRDIEGVNISLSAWLLGAPPPPELQQVQKWYPPAHNEIVARLFGLGRDSLLLSAHHEHLQGDASLRLQAASGDLFIDRDGIVRRDLQHARYRNGVITLQP